MPSLLSAPFDHLGTAIRELEAAGVNLLHYDVMDGHFVPNLAGSPMIIQDIESLIHCQFDVHLMVDRPERIVPWFEFRSVRSISVHVEASVEVKREFNTIRSMGKLAGIVINPSTPIGAIDPYLWLADQVLIMTVQPGLGGQSLIKETISKIDYIAQRRKELGLNYVIQADGGVNEETIQSVHQAGADEIVAGAAIFRQKNPVDAYRKLNRLIGNAG